MSRTKNHQRTHKYYALDKSIRASIFGPARKALFTTESWNEYKFQYLKIIKNKEGFSDHEISDKISPRHGNQRKMHATLKVKERRIKKRSERQAIKNFIKDSISE